MKGSKPAVVPAPPRIRAVSASLRLLRLSIYFCIYFYETNLCAVMYLYLETSLSSCLSPVTTACWIMLLRS